MENNKELDIELRSEPMNEMLSHPPKWIVRSGSGLFLMILFLVVGLAWFISYPDEISGSAIVTTTQPPIELNNQAYVQLTELHITDQQPVTSGQIIAQFDNQAKPEAIEKARLFIKKIQSYNGKLPDLIPMQFEQLQLGSFQQSWTVLISKVKEWNNYHQENIVKQQIASIRREISYREKLKDIASQKIKLSESEYALIFEEVKSSKRLAEQNAISRQVLNQDKRSETQALNNVQDRKEMYVQNLIMLNELHTNLIQIEHDAKKNEQQQASAIAVAVSTLENGFYEWKKNAIWVAPCKGKVIFNKLLQENRYYKAGEASLVVVPNGSGYRALAIIKSEGAGKVKRGQKALIEIADYPQSENGFVEGMVERITHIEKDGSYEVQIKLPQQLVTTYGKKLPVKAQLNGTVKIITKDKRLLSRFFERLTGILK